MRRQVDALAESGGGGQDSDFSGTEEPLHESSVLDIEPGRMKGDAWWACLNRLIRLREYIVLQPFMKKHHEESSTQMPKN